MKLTRSEVLGFLRSRQFISTDHLEISSPDPATCVRYRDLIDLYLAFCRVQKWDWVDSSGAMIAGQRPYRSLYNLFRGLGRYPFALRRIARGLALLENEAALHPSPAKNKFAAVLRMESVLFLRTDHWFGVKSGGSVGHLKGVIHGFRNEGLRTNVLSSDSLRGVDDRTDFYLLPPHCCELGNFPEIPEILYSSAVVDAVTNNTSLNAPDFIYQRYSLGNFAGAMLSHLLRRPFVCEYNGSFVWMADHWGRGVFHRDLLERIERVNLHAASLIVVVSEASRDELVQRGVAPAKILVNPNGVDTDAYSPSVSGLEVRRKFGLQDDTVVGFIGTFGPWHGAEVLAQAFCELVQAHPQTGRPARLLLIGAGSRLDAVKALVARSGCGASVLYAGEVPQEEGPQYLAACDILVAPHVPNPDGSPFFGSPTKLFEYMSMGRPIIASRLDQITVVVEDGRTGILVPPGSAGELATAMRDLISQPELRESLGRSARARALEAFTWRHHCRRILDALSEICPVHS